MRISDWSSDVCSSDLNLDADIARIRHPARRRRQRVERRRVVHELREENGRTLHAMAFRVTWFRPRSEEHTSELQSLMRISYAVFCLKKKINTKHRITKEHAQRSMTKKSIRTANKRHI